MNGRIQKISLGEDIRFREKNIGFNALLLLMLKAEAGTDAFIRFRFAFFDGKARLEQIESGIREKKDASSLQGSKDETRIPEGLYYFEEYPELSEEMLLPDTLSELLDAGTGNEVYVRLYKKNTLECVLQAFRPI